ncbi:hypothetical protein CEXT_745471 [Caerostris extrusa]|uniref:Uncharacterized protein n=1 Tax=Caerostris extrusa TaxID=172846 RepID=A0AAV4WHK6_CAEEX|nr:hypothetical protein CEXT_745471 [Caerostris extrusa]
MAKLWIHLIRSIAAEVFRRKNDERLNSSTVRHYPAGISHLAEKRVTCQDKWDQLLFFPSRKWPNDSVPYHTTSHIHFINVPDMLTNKVRLF